MNIYNDVSLASYTTIGIGGKIDRLIQPSNAEELVEAVEQTYILGVPFFVLAGGSNTVFCDDLIQPHQHVIQLSNIKGITRIIDAVYMINAGTRLQDCVDFSLDHHMSGMIGLNRIPGSIGGAIVGNAGAYGSEIADVVLKVDCIDLAAAKQGKLRIISLTKNECRFGYRDSIFKHDSNLCVFQIYIQLLPSLTPQDDNSQYWEIATKRDAVYPADLKSPGSTFKNIYYSELSEYAKSQIPSGWVMYGDKLPAGRLLEEVNAKGFRIGDIGMRESHANIMINYGNGTHQEVVDVITQLSERVKQRFNVFLEPEIRIIPPLFG